MIDAERDEPMTGFDADGVMTVDGRVLLGALDNAVAGRAPGSAFHVELSQWGSCTMELKGLRDKNGGLQAITVGQRVPRPGTDAMPMALSNRDGSEPRMMTLEGNTAILLLA